MATQRTVVNTLPFYLPPRPPRRYMHNTRTQIAPVDGMISFLFAVPPACTVGSARGIRTPQYSRTSLLSCGMHAPRLSRLAFGDMFCGPMPSIMHKVSCVLQHYMGMFSSTDHEDFVVGGLSTQVSTHQASLTCHFAFCSRRLETAMKSQRK